MVTGILFTTCLILANILAVKIIQLGPFAVPAAVIIFPIAYILNDIIAEVWGFKKARLIIWTGFAMNVLMVSLFSIAIALPAAGFWADQDSFVKIMGSTPRIVLASLMAYLVGSFLNAYVMSRMKLYHKGRNFGLRAVASTMVGELADSIIFMSVAFMGLFPIDVLLVMIFTQAMVKTVYEILVLPVTRIIVAWVKRVEGQDVFDEKVSYNPFKVAEV